MPLPPVMPFRHCFSFVAVDHFNEGADMKNRMRLMLTVTALVTGMLGFGGHVGAVGKQNFFMAVPGSYHAAPGSSVVRPGAAIERAMTSGQTGIFVVSRAQLASDGAVETLGVVENGRLVDLSARRNGAQLTRTSTSGTRHYTSAQYQQLLAFGVDRPITNGQLMGQFLAIGAGAAGTSPGQGQVLPPCPADYAGMHTIQKRIAETKPEYRGCLTRVESGRSASSMFADFLDLKLIAAAEAANYSLLFFEVSANAFFSTWGFEYQADSYFAINIGGMRAIFGVTG